MSYAELQAKDWPETPADTLTNKLMGLTEFQQRRVLNYLWGTMTIRDPQACIDAMAWVANTRDSEAEPQAKPSASKAEWTITHDGADSLGEIFMVRRNGESWTRARSMSEARDYIWHYKRSR